MLKFAKQPGPFSRRLKGLKHSFIHADRLYHGHYNRKAWPLQERGAQQSEVRRNTLYDCGRTAWPHDVANFLTQVSLASQGTFSCRTVVNCADYVVQGC